MTRTPQLRFGPFELDPVRRILRQEGRPIALTDRPMDLLLTLVGNRDRVLSREELLGSVWSDAIVEEANLTQTVSVLRKSLGEGPGDNAYIVTVTGRGYRFVAPVESAEPEPTVRDRQSGWIWRLPAIVASAAAVGGVVLVLLIVIATNLGEERGSPPAAVMEAETLAILPILADGFDRPAGARGVALADAVINRLVERGLAVRPTRSILEFADPRRDTPQQAGRALGVGIVVTAALIELGSTARFSLQFTRSQDGRTLWAGSAEVETAGAGTDDRIADAMAGLVAEIVHSLEPPDPAI